METTKITETKISMFKSVIGKTDIKAPATVNALSVLLGIKNGRWKDKIDQIRARKTKSDQDALKRRLPAVLWGGIFSERRIDAFQQSSNLVGLDFDPKTKEEAESIKKLLRTKKYIFAYFQSPRGLGVKAVALAEFSSYDEYKSVFCAIDNDLGQLEAFDLVNSDISRACFVSYDPDIYINENVVPFNGYIDNWEEYLQMRRIASPEKTFEYLQRWLEKRGDKYEIHHRNEYLYKLGSAMCRYGIEQDTTTGFFLQKYTDLPVEEIYQVVRSAYKRNEFGIVRMTEVKPEDDKYYDSLETPDFSFDPEAALCDDYEVNNGVFKIAHKEKDFQSIGLKAMDKYFVLKSNEYYAFVAKAKAGKTLNIIYLAAMAAKYAGWRFIVLTTETEVDEYKALMVSFLNNTYISNLRDDTIADTLQFIDAHFEFVDNIVDHLQILDVYHYKKTKGEIYDAIIIDPLTNVDHSPLIPAKDTHSYYNILNSKYLKFSKKYCSLWVVSHVRSEAERSNTVPQVQDGEFGVYISRRCHYGITFYRDSGDAIGKYTTEMHVKMVRTKITRGGDTTPLESPIKFTLKSGSDGFGYDVEVDGETWKNPLVFENELANPPLPDFSGPEIGQRQMGIGAMHTL